MKQNEQRTFKKEQQKTGGITMKNIFTKHIKNEKGLTLIELLAVIVILAIVALIAIPSIGNIIANSKSKAVLSDASQIISSAKIAIADGACGDASGATVTCDKAALDGLVEGVTLDANDKVVKSATDYTITYAGFSNLKDGKVKKAFDAVATGTGKTTITSKDLAKVMGN